MQNKCVESFAYIHGNGNFFHPCRESKWAVVNISKNAITSIKSYMLEKRGLPELPHFTVHRMIGNYEGYYGIPIDKMKEFEEENGKYIKFAVIRNPIKRFLSTYDLFFMQGFPHACFDEMKEKGIKTLSQFINASASMLRTPLEYQDAHIKKQKDYFTYDDVDYIVDIGCLDVFMREVLHEDFHVRRNQTNLHCTPTEEELAKIYSLYKDDVDFIGRIPEEKHVQKA